MLPQPSACDVTIALLQKFVLLVDTITINTSHGDVTINVKDANGNFLTPGTKVIGSDGNEY